MTFDTAAEASRLKAAAEPDDNLRYLVVVHFRDAKKYIHADQYWFDFYTGLHWYIRSNSANSWGEGIQKYTWPHLEDDHHSVDAETWAAYLCGGHRYGEAVVPFFNIGLSKNPYLERRSTADKYLFLNSVLVCPLCGSSTASDCKDTLEFTCYEQWQVSVLLDEEERVAVKRFYNQRQFLQGLCDRGWNHLKHLLDTNQLHSNFIKHSRCRRCRENGWGFRDAWKYRHQHVVRPTYGLHRDDWEQCQSALKLIEGIWPEDFQKKPAFKKYIFRHARKRARIKPLSRGELAFFSMHLAAAQIKELKATNRTHDTNKILNEAN